MLKYAVIAMLLAPLAGFSQKGAADKIFDQYSGKDGFTSVDITKGLFELFADIDSDDPDFDDFQNAVKGIESMRLLAYSVKDNDGTVAEKEKFMNDIKNDVSLVDFDELMVVRDKDKKVNFYAKSDKQTITEMIMIVDGADEAVLLSLYGDIDLNHIAKLGSSMKMGGMEYLGKMKHE
jgi:hypothetical protein